MSPDRIKEETTEPESKRQFEEEEDATWRRIVEMALFDLQEYRRQILGDH